MKTFLQGQDLGRVRRRPRRLYAQYGVREYWLIDLQARTVEVTSLGDGYLETVGIAERGTVVTSPLLPGLAIAVDDLFAF